MKRLYMTLVALGGLYNASQAMTPSLSTFNHEAAFVAPLTTVKGKKIIFLGRESTGRDKGLFDAFGGKRDASDGNHPVMTAARELHEEGIVQQTLGMSEKELLDHVDLKAGNTELILAVQKANGSSRHVLCLTGFSNKQARAFKNTFATAYANAPRGRQYREKDEIASLVLDDLLQAIAASRSNVGIHVVAHVVDLQGSVSKKLIILRPVFARMLRGYAEGRTAIIGKDKRIRFYTL